VNGRGVRARAFSRFVRPAPRYLTLLALAACPLAACSKKPPPAVKDGGTAPAPAALGSFAHAPSGSGPLFPVLEGRCAGLQLSAVDGATFVSYGAELLRGTDDGVGYVPELAAGWPLASANLRLGRVAGVFVAGGPRRLDVRVDGVRSIRHGLFDGSAWRWDETFDVDRGDRDGGSAFLSHQAWETRPWLKGSRLHLSGCRELRCGDETPRVKLVTLGEGAPAAPNMSPSDSPEDEVMAFDALPSGDVYAVLRHCGDGPSRPAYEYEDAADGHCVRVSHWSPAGAKLETWTVPMGASGAPEGPTASILARSPTEVYVGSRRRGYRESSIAAFDGARWRSVDDGVTSPGLYDAGADGVWARGMSGVVRVSAAAKDSKVVNIPADTQSVQGTRSRRGADPWAFGRDALFRRESGIWGRVALPILPGYGPAAVMEVEVAGADDTWVHLQYTALADTTPAPASTDEVPFVATPERDAPFDVVLRTRRPAEVKRCQAPRVAETLVDWPPAAGPSCATPVVLLFPLESSDIGREKATRDAALLRSRRPGLAPFVTVRFGDRTFVGMRAKEVDSDLPALLWSAVPGARLEIVCLPDAADQPFVLPPGLPTQASAAVPSGTLPPPPPRMPDLAPKKGRF
jgi:hypothetical protein